MTQNFLPSLKIARLQYQSGDFLQAKNSIEEACKEAHQLGDVSQWLEALRIQIQCFIELEQLEKTEQQETELLEFLKKNTDLFHAATAEYILGILLLNHGHRSQAQAYLASAISKASQTKNIRSLAYALYADSYLKTSSSDKDLPQASVNLEKIEVLSSQEPLAELMISVRLLRCYIQTELGHPEQALLLLWEAYESAKLQGLNVVVSSILAQMARIHQNANRQSLYQIYADLALCGVDKDKHPRLFRQISQIYADATPRSHDIEVDEDKRLILEKKRGAINFGNQHILMDMALLFLKNPGKRYSKSELFEYIWQQPYDSLTHDNLIYVSIKRLRTLLEPDDSPQYLLKDRKGYYLNPQITIQFKSDNKCNKEIA
ncbi:MAG TPA: helix-turn-helix domain-containing protein [Pseudobdellovibrionaceae bacterium]|jgi:DNA-binding winged helix-turn-helix (wHTH) protein